MYENDKEVYTYTQEDEITSEKGQGVAYRVGENIYMQVNKEILKIDAKSYELKERKETERDYILCNNARSKTIAGTLSGKGETNPHLNTMREPLLASDGVAYKFDTETLVFERVGEVLRNNIQEYGEYIVSQGARVIEVKSEYTEETMEYYQRIVKVTNKVTGESEIYPALEYDISEGYLYIMESEGYIAGSETTKTRKIDLRE